MIPRHEWWNIIEAYGTQIWPAQVILYAGAVLVVVWFLIKRGRIHTLFTKIYLSIAFAWNAIAFFMILAKGITGNTKRIDNTGYFPLSHHGTRFDNAYNRSAAGKQAGIHPASNMGDSLSAADPTPQVRCL